MSRGFPYRRPPRDIVRVSEWWQLKEGARIAPLPAELPEWDHNSTLQLTRRVQIDGGRARADCGLTNDAVLVLSVRWNSSASLMRGLAWRQTVPPEDGHSCTVEFLLDGGELDDVLTLDLLLSLGTPTEGTSSVSPSLPGAVLWSESVQVQLGSSSPLFPVAAADFRQLPYPDHAAWMLEVSADLTSPALGSLLLVVNETNQVIAQAMRGSTEPTPMDQAVLSVMRADALRLLVEHALADDDFNEQREYAASSLGAVMQSLLRVYLGGVAAETLRREQADIPSLFNARIQDAARMLEVPT